MEHPRILVPTEMPASLQPVAAATRRTLRETTADSERIKHAKSSSAVLTAVSAARVDRTVRIMQAFATAAVARGFEFVDGDDGIKLRLGDVSFEWKIYEIRDRIAHQPTRQELKAQAEHDERRARYPQLYSDRQVYRSWDFVPSGRLGMSIADATSWNWSRDRYLGHWRDRKTTYLERYLDDAMTAMVAGAVAIRHRLAEEAEKERRRQVEIARQERERARRDRAIKRHEYLVRKAREFAPLQQLEAFADHVRHKLRSGDSDYVQAQALGEELEERVELLKQGFEREAMQAEIEALQLFDEGEFDRGEEGRPDQSSR